MSAARTVTARFPERVALFLRNLDADYRYGLLERVIARSGVGAYSPQHYGSATDSVRVPVHVSTFLGGIEMNQRGFIVEQELVLVPQYELEAQFPGMSDVFNEIAAEDGVLPDDPGPPIREALPTVEGVAHNVRVQQYAWKLAAIGRQLRGREAQRQERIRSVASSGGAS